MIRNGAIGEPEREVISVPEREPIPEPMHVPDSPADLPEPERVPA